ncbi:TonB-dependent receptor [Polaribacter atrinae]|uniref:TonB-dependent receptor n=1 Tax=Polaribacter atrinae TaxID=1333662 RepID=A0A176TFW6_9FLAO|nr:TonB-dependent receptor [Polaribacter atrinae]OAD46808.1 TonB-dependent receptor [Polaribacter atrinae]
MPSFFKTLILLLISYTTFGQEGDFYGKVKTDDNELAIDVFVVIKGDHFYKETVTDFNGEFYIKSVPYGTHNIQFHSLNSKPKTITVQLNSKKKEVNVFLESIKNQLDEVRITTKTEETKKETKGFAVNVIKTAEASLRNIQTNELLNATAGVKIRQNGGLGSDVSYSLNGLSGNAVRIFIDGIPSSMYGSSYNLNSIPPSMIKNIEVYKGVVPGHLSDDALGGAINIVLHNDARTNLNASISYGSFNTIQANVNGLYRYKESGFTVKSAIFHNYSDNDYKVSGRSVVDTGLGGVQTPITARRFNDAYKSTGGMFQAGYTDVKWADQFLVGFNASKDYKEVQHGAFMTIIPYKDRFLESDALLANMIYKKKNLFVKGLDVNINGLYGERNRAVNDTLAAAYSWTGERAIDFRGNEYDYTWGSQQEGGPTLAKIKRKVASIRSGISYTINDQHTVLANHVYSGVDREDSDVLVSVLENTFKGTRNIDKNIYSLTYEFTALQNRLRTSVFGKHYQQKTTSVDPKIITDSNGTKTIVDEVISSNNEKDGYGFAASYAISPKVTLLASAEKAVRLPDETEVFGNDGDNVVANPTIKPEQSNNYNLGFRFGTFNIKNHDFTISTNVFTRNIKDRIGLPIETSFNIDNELIVYVNQGSGTSKGIDAQLNYTYNRNFGFNFNVSRFDLKIINTGTEIDVPNTPFFTMNGSLRYSFKDLIQKESRLNLFYSMYFTDEFSYLVPQGSNTVGNNFFDVPKQFAQDLGISYSFPNKKLVASFDIKNIFDKPVYDNLSVQKPGRAFYIKLNYTINKFN